MHNNEWVSKSVEELAVAVPNSIDTIQAMAVEVSCQEAKAREAAQVERQALIDTSFPRLLRS